MSRKGQINRSYIEDSVTDAEHPYRKGFGSLRDDDDNEGHGYRPTINHPTQQLKHYEWSRDRLKDRLIEGGRVMEMSVGRVGPGGARGFWPESYDLFQNEFDEVVRGYHSETPGRSRRMATSDQIKRADIALSWPKKYVSNLHIPKVLNAWITSKAKRIKWKKVVEARGWSLATADRCRDRALAEIIQGLQRDGVIHE